MKRIVLLTLPLLAACGPRYGMRVPDEMVKKLPYETRIELLEAENDLALAIDKVDEASSEIVRARDNIRRARSRAQDAEKELERADDPSPARWPSSPSKRPRPAWSTCAPASGSTCRCRKWSSWRCAAPSPASSWPA